MKLLMVPTFHDRLGNTGRQNRLLAGGIRSSGQARETPRGEWLRPVSAYIDTFVLLTVAASIMFLLSFIVRKNRPKAGGQVAVG